MDRICTVKEIERRPNRTNGGENSGHLHQGWTADGFTQFIGRRPVGLRLIPTRTAFLSVGYPIHSEVLEFQLGQSDLLDNLTVVQRSRVVN